MKKIILLIVSGLTITNLCYASDSASKDSASKFVKAGLEMKNVHGIVSTGTWFNMELLDSVQAEAGNQHFTATLIDPIYNKNFTEGLIPAKTLVNGTYKTDGKTCSFNIDTITYKGTEIDLLPGAYTDVNVASPNQTWCNPKSNYSQGQYLEFQTKVDISDLTPINFIKNYVAVNSTDNYVQSLGNSDYNVIKINKFSNGLMQVMVKFNNINIKDKLVPVFFDEQGIPHCLNYSFMLTQDNELDQLNNIYSYLVLSHYNNFGFGILDN